MQNKNRSWQRHPSRPKSADASGEVQIIVDGISGLATESVIQRLVLKAQELHSKSIKVNRHFINDGKLVLFVQSQIQADTLKKLSGIRIGKMNRLLIDYPSSQQQQQPSAIDNINQLIQSRYNPAAKFLNLDSIDSSYFARGSKAGEVLCKIIGQLCPEVETISFAQNRIKSLHNLSTLPKTNPNLINLSFKDNQITSYRDIDVFNGRDMPRLRELLFQGNPVSPDPSNTSEAAMLQYQ